MVSAYDKTTHDGKVVDWITHAALIEAEIKLGYRLTIVQGSYNGTAVAASAGTHAGGGCVDLAPWDHVRKVRVLRDLGFAVWWRTPIPGVWGEHIHAVLIGNSKLAPVAAQQITSYRNRRDGLAQNGSDNTYHPSPIPTYKWPGSTAALALEKKAAALLDKPAAPAPAPAPKPLPVPARTVRSRLALDWSFSAPTFGKLPSRVPGALRYVSPGSTKDLTTDEAARLHAAGKWIGLVYESTAGRAGEGRRAGTADAATAKAKADALGYPTSACVFYAVDFDAAPAKILPYFQGIKAATNRPVGVYGSKRVVEAVMAAGLADYAWQTAAWSNGQVAAGISFYQHVGTTLTGIGGAWDENSILGPKVPVWQPAKVPAPKPTPKPKPVVVPPTTFRLVETNVRGTNPLATVIKHIHTVADQADVVVWNELRTKQMQDAVRALPGFESFVSGEVGISWRVGVLEAAGVGVATLVNKGVLTITPNRYVVTVPLRHVVSGKVYRQKGGHAVQHIEAGGRARVKGQILGQNARARVYFATLGAELAADALLGPAVFCGDLNVDQHAEERLAADKRTPWFPLTVLGAVGTPHAVAGGTHAGGRWIDWLVTAGPVQVANLRTLDPGSSDHRPVAADITIA